MLVEIKYRPGQRVNLLLNGKNISAVITKVIINLEESQKIVRYKLLGDDGSAYAAYENAALTSNERLTK